MHIPKCPCFSPRTAVSAMGCFVIAAVTLGASGCNDAQLGRDVARFQNKEDGNGVLRIDLGCIQRGSKIEFCIPLEKLRIASHAEIDSIKSSCECVNVNKVQFRAGNNGERSDGVLVAVLPPVHPMELPGALRVRIEIAMDEGRRFIEVDFIETDFVSIL